MILGFAIVDGFPFPATVLLSVPGPYACPPPPTVIVYVPVPTVNEETNAPPPPPPPEYNPVPPPPPTSRYSTDAGRPPREVTLKVLLMM